jgi:hypothetical protein
MMVGLAAGLVGVMANNAPADLVTGWGLETGQANATLTEGVAGSFSTTTPTGNAGPRAVLSSPFSFGSIGDMVHLSGSVSLVNTLGNQQFRFGLYNNNGHALGTLSSGLWSGADPVGWLGYMVQVGNAGGATATKGRDGATGVWLSNTGSYVVDNHSETASPGPGTYYFDLTLCRSAVNVVDIAYLFTQTSGGTFSSFGSFSDIGGLSSGVSSINTMGFLLNANTGAGVFSGIDVSVPEPSALALGLLGLAATLVRRHRK